MHRRYQPPLVWTTLTVTLLACASPSFAFPFHKKISEQQAIEIAEKFVKRCGITTLSNFTSLATIEPKAYGVVSPKRKSDGYLVAFRYSEATRAYFNSKWYAESTGINTVGRAVTMNSTGRHVVIHHKDFFLANARKL